MITEDMVQQAEINVMVRQLREAGFIVIPPSERKTRTIGPFVITTDPVGFSIGWKRS